MIMGKHKCLVPKELHPEEAVLISSTEHSKSPRVMFTHFFIHLNLRTPFFLGLLEINGGSSVCFAPMGTGMSRDRKILTEDRARKMWGEATGYQRSCKGNLQFQKLCLRIILPVFSCQSFSCQTGLLTLFLFQIARNR